MLRRKDAGVRIVNNTHWQTRDLRRIATRVVREEFPRARFGDRRKRFTVYVGYNRAGNSDTYSSGHASLNSNYCYVNVPSGRVDQVDFAHVLAHECGHCKGLEHGSMPPHMESTSVRHRGAYIRQHFAWAAAIPVRKAERKRKARPTAGDKLEHAVAMLARARTRLKRAQTLERRWKRKVTYYARVGQQAARGKPDGEVTNG